jgi:hypothetical protein
MLAVKSFWQLHSHIMYVITFLAPIRPGCCSGVGMITLNIVTLDVPTAESNHRMIKAGYREKVVTYFRVLY